MSDRFKFNFKFRGSKKSFAIALGFDENQNMFGSNYAGAFDEYGSSWSPEAVVPRIYAICPLEQAIGKI
ncbi:MAG: hypothetical protein P8Z37_03535 [Acidobacteriota bacterium]